MPTILRNFLTHLSDQDMDLVWDYLDGYPEALDEMIELVATEDGSYHTQKQSE